MTLTWNGLDLRPAHRRWFFWVADGRDSIPEVRTSTELIPFRRGRLHQPAIANRRRLEVRGSIQEATPAAMRADLDALKTLLDPEVDEPGILSDDFEDGSIRWMRAIPRNVIPTVGNEAVRLLSIELEALDPYWYGSYGTLALDSGYVLDAGEDLDSGAEIVISGSGAASFDTLGNAAVERVRVRFVGPSTGPVGIQVAGAELLGFTVARTLAAGETLEVDNMQRSALIAGASVRNVMTLLPGNQHGEYLRLPAGAVTARSTGGAAQTRILFNPTYL